MLIGFYDKVFGLLGSQFVYSLAGLGARFSGIFVILFVLSMVSWCSGYDSGLGRREGSECVVVLGTWDGKCSLCSGCGC